MEEEEKDIFEQARKIFTEDDVEKFADRFATRKAAERRLVDEKAEASLKE